MSIPLKSILSLTLLVLLGLSVVSKADAVSGCSTPSTVGQIQVCVSDSGRYADHDNASQHLGPGPGCISPCQAQPSMNRDDL